jgi:hypothetical protein
MDSGRTIMHGHRRNVSSVRLNVPLSQPRQVASLSLGLYTVTCVVYVIQISPHTASFVPEDRYKVGPQKRRLK